MRNAGKDSRIHRREENDCIDIPLYNPFDTRASGLCCSSADTLTATIVPGLPSRQVGTFLGFPWGKLSNKMRLMRDNKMYLNMCPRLRLAAFAVQGCNFDYQHHQSVQLVLFESVGLIDDFA